MESIKKYWIWGIFISILSIFAMSHNASALDFGLDLSNYELINSGRINTQVVYNGNTTSCANVSYCTLPNNDVILNITKIKTSVGLNNYKKDDIVRLTIVFDHNANYSQENVFGFDYYETNDSKVSYIGARVLDQTTFTDIYSSSSTISQYEDYVNDVYSRAGLFKAYEIYLRVREDLPNNYYFGLESTNINFPLMKIITNPQGASLNVRIANLSQFRFVGSEENREVEQKTQEAVDDSEAAGGSSSQDAQTGTTGLLNAITGAVSVISSASPTNCKINGNMGNLDMGQLDLCANPAPAFVQTIGSLILILMCVPLAISLFNRFIAIFRSFQS